MKNKTIPFLFSLFLLASCGETKPCETHTYGDFTVTKEASCGVAGSKERTCTVCGEKDVVAIDALTHNYVDAADQAGAVAATCAAKGKVITECSNCHDKSFREVDKLTTHTFVDATDQTGAKPATCKEAGTVITQCSVCGEKSTRVAEKLTTHTYGEYTQTKAPTHAAEGSKEAICSVCGAKDTQPIAKLTAHEFGETPTHVDADHDVIAMDVYNCATDNVKKIVWNANDVSSETKTVKYNNEDNYVTSNGGVKFGGRSKGNNFTKPASAPTYVFDSNVPGSFVEYTINIKSAMVGAQLSADMESANWLNNNAGLFLSAPKGSDYTPGLVADPDSTDGYKIPEFRMDVLVNGKAVTMDASKNIAGQSKYNRGWYDFPCTVDLKAGVNTIKIVQAGGWEPTFYNFGVTSAEGIDDVIPAASEGFTVGVSGDEHVSSITVYEDKACTIVDTADVHYSRIDSGRKSQDGDGQISFAVEVAEGYQVKEIIQETPVTKVHKNIKNPTDTEADCGKDNVYRITKIEDNCTFKVITEPKDVVYTGYEITFVLGEHVTGIEIYNSKTYAADTKIEGLVATSLDESTLKPTKSNEGQIYFKVFFDEGYEIDEGATNGQFTDAKPYKNLKLPGELGENNFRLTKVNADATMTIFAKAIA